MQVVKTDMMKQDMGDNSNKGRKVVVDGVVSEENMEWLQQSVIGETIKPINFPLLVDRVMNEWLCVTNVREIEAYKILVTFATKEDREEAIGLGRDLLLSYFAEVRLWFENEWCQTMRTWIQCY